MEEDNTNFNKILEAFQDSGKQYTVTIDSESTGGLVNKVTPAFSPKKIQAPYITPTNDLAKAFESFFSDGGVQVSGYEETKPIPAVYDTMDDKDNVKISEKHPKFAYGALLDEILEEFGGVQEIVRCLWDDVTDSGEVVCLMNDWRVFRYVLKQNDFVTLKPDERKSKINRECMIHEDMDDWGHWEELGGTREEQEKKAMVQKVEEEKQTAYGEKYSDALSNFFNGGLEAIQKMMSKNDGKKSSYLESEG